MSKKEEPEVRVGDYVRYGRPGWEYCGRIVALHKTSVTIDSPQFPNLPERIQRSWIREVLSPSIDDANGRRRAFLAFCARVDTQLEHDAAKLAKRAFLAALQVGCAPVVNERSESSAPTPERSAKDKLLKLDPPAAVSTETLPNKEKP